MQANAEALRILHDPTGYYRPWQGRLGSLSSGQRAALNAWLTERFALPGAPVTGAIPDTLATRVIDGWQRLPATAWLMACAAHRGSLLGSRMLLRQPPAVHAFMLLGFGTGMPARALPPEALLSWGGQHLQAGLSPRLPRWLGARLRLWFAGLPEPPPVPASSRVEFDLTCFWSAWNHAADLPGPPAGFRG